MLLVFSQRSNLRCNMDDLTAASSPHMYSSSVRRTFSPVYAAGAGYQSGSEKPDDQAFGLQSRCPETTVRAQAEEITSLYRQLSEAKQVLQKLEPNRTEARPSLHESTPSSLPVCATAQPWQQAQLVEMLQGIRQLADKQRSTAEEILAELLLQVCNVFLFKVGFAFRFFLAACMDCSNICCDFDDIPQEEIVLSSACTQVPSG